MASALWCAVQVFLAVLGLLAFISLSAFLALYVRGWLMERAEQRAEMSADVYAGLAAAAPSCRCEVCEYLTCDAVFAIFAEIVEADWTLEEQGFYDVDRAINKLLPPQPPVIPGRPDQDA